MTFADDSNIVNLHNWSMGSFSGMSWEHIRIMVIIVGITVVITFGLAKPISAYQMGESYARNMGVNVKVLRIALILLSSLLSACVTAFAGPISFVGIAVPHLIKLATHTAKPIILIPGCFLGGALYHDNSADNKELTGKAYFFHERALENKKEKEAIAANAIHMVKDHMCIFLDASSTAYTLGMKLTGFTELTVITNGIDLALALKDIPGITVILTGGIVTSASSSIEGLLGVDLLQKIHTDIAFVSARGFSVENGLTDFSIYEADLKRMCIKASAKTIALIDHTKFDTSSISSYASIDDLNLVITDSGLSENTKEIYEKAGVDLLIAD